MEQDKYAISYRDQQLTVPWEKKRKEILLAYNYECQRCKERKEKLHIHHTVYRFGKKIWEYTEKELIPLCRACHNNVHLEEEIKVIFSNGTEKSINFGNSEDCSRCDGKGIIDRFININKGICYQCWGVGYYPFDLKRSI